jgi:hypothetical protein
MEVDLTKIFFLIFHLIEVLISGMLLLISTNLYVIGGMALILLLVFGLCIYFDGCIVSKFEGNLPIIGITPTHLLKLLLFLDNDMQLKELEKIFLGFTFAAYVGKFSILLLVKLLTNESLPVFIDNLKNKEGISKLIHKILV